MTCPGTTTGWFADPIFGDRGDYPESMRALLGDLLPRFTPAQVRGAASERERSRGTTTRDIQLDRAGRNEREESEGARPVELALCV